MTSLTPEQQAAAFADCSVVITAGAGTGKTHLLAERYLYYLRERNLSPLEIVAVTFTEKAATELRSRIRALVSQQLPTRLDLLAELEAAPISTIHALAARICTEHFQLIGIPADFQILDDLEGRIWLQDVLKTALTQLPPETFTIVAYSALQQILPPLLDDPHTASQALRQGIQDWQKLITIARNTAVQTIINDAQWQPIKSILEQHQGNETDKLEAIRLSVLAAMADLETSRNIDLGIATIDGVNLRVGSKKNWQDDTLQIVKNTLKQLRETVRSVTTQGLLDLALGDGDQQLKLMLPAITEAYQEVSSYLSKLKLQRQVLTFSDLEIYALKALAQKSVQEYYQQRWQVFLVDEFQDTNPTQAEVLTALTLKAELTIVGDIKQSIYGFRRADIRVFQQFRDRILADGGKEVILSTSFRSHQTLIDTCNQIFKPLLRTNHQDLTAFRESTSIKTPNSPLYPYLQVITIGDPLPPGETATKPNSTQRHIVEANCLAEKIKQMLDNKTPVFDRQTRNPRPIEPQDIAILTRTWQPLEIYSQALSALGIPVAPAGGGNLLATREAKDVIALLRFLANPEDDIALIAVLRSPWFALSDRLLYQIRQSFPQPDQGKGKFSWWTIISQLHQAELAHPIRVLKQLLIARKSQTPSRILQLSDRLTGYTAVIANLTGAKRRLADWQGCYQLVKNLEQGTYDLFSIVRRLQNLSDREVAIPRPIMTVNNAVSLMTIFASKGLEWSLVIVADLSKERPKASAKVYFDSQWGIAIKHQTPTGETLKPVLYRWLEYQQEQKERAEAVRVLYVALTRARDYLILSAAEPYKGELNRLQKGLTAAKISALTIPYSDLKALPPIAQNPTRLQKPSPLLLNRAGSGLSELPVTALTDYARCPQRFKLHFLDGHPGLTVGLASAIEIGTLVHKALELNITTPQDLVAFTTEDTAPAIYQEAIALAQRFFQLPLYQAFRDTAIAKEQPISLQLGQITFNGVIDLVGTSWILDYKSDRFLHPNDHRFQLWAYAKSLGVPQAYIAYLRHDHLHYLPTSELQAIAPQAEHLAHQIYQGDYTATPTMEKCALCPYIAFCNDAII